MNNKPEVVTLCGSTRFPEAFVKAVRDLTLQGKIVISVGLFGHQEGIDMDGPVKAMLDELHLRKIDMSDSIFVVNATLLTCQKCEKPCGSLPNDYMYCNSDCCRASAMQRPYIGESTRREIEYAVKVGKRVEYLYTPGKWI